MRRFILLRLLQALLILFTLSIVVFALLRIAPGDPIDVICPFCPKPQREAIREELGLNDPYFPISLRPAPPFIDVNSESQYGAWVTNLFTGSLGEDLYQAPVAPELERRLPATAELLLVTVAATVALGVGFGVVSALWRNSPADYAARVAATFGQAVPTFWLATLALMLPMLLWSYAPPLTRTIAFFDNPWDNLRQFGPPGLVLGVVASASVMRLTRSSLLEVLQQDYVRTARAKGLTERLVISRHALRNSLIPVVTVLGLQIIGLLGGAIVVELVFNIEGIGKYLFFKLLMRDYQPVQTLTLYIGAVAVLMNLAVDIAYAWLDPRIRYA